MRIKNLLLLITIGVICQGCSGLVDSANDINNPNITTPTTYSTISVDKPTVMNTEMAFPEYSPSTEVTDTPLRLTKTLEEQQTYCFQPLSEIPDQRLFEGKIIVDEDLLTDGERNIQNVTYSLDLATQEKALIRPGRTNGFQTSPDRLKYAVIDADDHKVKVYSANEDLLKEFPLGEFRYSIDMWINNNQIMLVILEPLQGTDYYKYPRDQKAVNLITDEQTLLPSDFPDIDRALARLLWEGISTTKYDSRLTRVVYPSNIKNGYEGKSGPGYVLWDILNEVKLQQIVTGTFTATPKWSPDGSKFVINDNYGDGEFYTVSRDGKVTQISHLNPENVTTSTGLRYFSDTYSWSPDGKHLAFWLERTVNSMIEATFAILNTDTGAVLDTCISAGYIDKGVPSLLSFYMPIWSKDGKSVVTVATMQESGDFQTVLIDLEGKFVVKLGNNQYPVGWLVKK